MKAKLEDKIETKYKQKWNLLHWFSFPSWQKRKNKHRAKTYESWTWKIISVLLFISSVSKFDFSMTTFLKQTTQEEQGLLSPWFIWVPLFSPSGPGDGPTVWEVAFSSVMEVTFWNAVAIVYRKYNGGDDVQYDERESFSWEMRLNFILVEIRVVK